MKITVVVLGLGLLVAGCLRPPKGEEYRLVTVEAPSRLELEWAVRLTCETPWRPAVKATPFRYEIALDTVAQCLCGARCYVIKRSPPGTGLLRIRGYDREGMKLDTFTATTGDTILIYLSSLRAFPR